MMTSNRTLYARAGAAAIAAAVALSPTYAASPKPIVDLSQSAADTGAKPAPAAKPQKDDTLIEYGGGALALLIIGGGLLAITSRKRRRERESWEFDDTAAEQAPVAEAEATTFAEPVREQPAMVAPPMSAFEEPRRQAAEASDCEELESWTERAKCGPTPDNPSQSLKKRMKRAAFFEKRDREVAAGEAAPVDPDAGLPESLDESETA